MITPQHLINAIEMQIGILKHLGSKVTAENKDVRLTPAQRSIEELQHYIVSSLPAQMHAMVTWVLDMDWYMAFIKQYDGFTFEQFTQKLDDGFAMIKTDILSLSDEQRQEPITMWAWMHGPRTMFLNDYVLEFLGAYKMQLFLQLKASWLTDLWTSNLWSGIDTPKS
jgi:hypothetical protein